MLVASILGGMTTCLNINAKTLLRMIGVSILLTLTTLAVQARQQNNQSVINFISAGFTIRERQEVVRISVLRTGDTSSAATVEYQTDDNHASIDCSEFTGLASARCDFNLAAGTLEFAAGETEKFFTVVINRDGFVEPPFETFTVKLTNAIGATLGPITTAEVRIIDFNDGSPEATRNPLDRTVEFVRQQYHDFLNREPDVDGLAFWVDNIDKCDDDAWRPRDLTVTKCKESMRVNTSAAFFLSIEFLQSGGLVHAFYAAALERERRLPLHLEFVRDVQLVQRGVVVGEPGWAARLASNRARFMTEFVMRDEYLSLYPTDDSPDAYVRKLYQHALDRPVTEAELAEGVREFGGSAIADDAKARARVLLQVTESPDFVAEFNRTFVQMQYNGYLQRNPEEPPDRDFNGFDFWLDKLNSFNGNFVDAEMVKAFIESIEYRSRFGK